MGTWDVTSGVSCCLVSHPVQLSSGHTVGHLKGFCVPIGQLDRMGHQDWVLSLSYETYDRWESYTLHEQSLAILNNPHKVKVLFL